MTSITRIVKSLFTWTELEDEALSDGSDSSLVQKHSLSFKYNDKVTLRTVVIPHYKANKFRPQDLPCIVFIHGLGGQVAQFDALIDSLSSFAHILAVDLPSCGGSAAVNDWSMYTPEVLTDMLYSVIEHTLREEGNTENESLNEPRQSTQETTKHTRDSVRDDSDGDDQDKKQKKKKNHLPTTIPPQSKIILLGHSMGTVLVGRLSLKLKDRCSAIVAITPPPPRLEEKLAKSQKYLPYIPQFVFSILRAMDRDGGPGSTSVSRMVSTSTKHDSEVRMKQLRWNLQVDMNAWVKYAYYFEPFTTEDWARIVCPVLVIGAQHDKVTPPDNLDEITGALQNTASGPPVVISDAGHAVMAEQPHVVCGVITDFLRTKVDSKLDAGWQLARLATESDKWSLKNEQKWKNTMSVGHRVAPDAPFRGMKTLRQDDPEHSPSILERDYPTIKAVIDISRDPPPYDPSTFARIHYKKFPSVSKMPPTKSEVRGFIAAAAQCFADMDGDDGEIGVHCHYGFNRTGFFICSYMIEKLGYSVEKAVQCYAQSRSGGIRHQHFIDELHVRYKL